MAKTKFITLSERPRINVKDKNNLVALRGAGEVYLDKDMKKLHYKTDNLIVYISREIIAQRIFGVNRVTPAPGTPGQSEYTVNFLSVGSGGASSSDPFSPLVVNNEDLGLINEVRFTTDFVGNPLYAINGFKKRIGDKQILQDDLNNNRYIIVKTTTIIGKDECNGNFLNEAALWFTHSEDGTEIDSTNIVMASRFTFPSMMKTSELEPIIVWYWFL